MAYDVAVAHEAEDGVRFLDYNVARERSLAAGLMYAAPLARGPLAQCLAHNPRFTSTLPAALRLPPLPDDPNLAEGIVVRPAREPPPHGHGGRALVKIKIGEFSERQYQNDGWRDTRSGRSSDGPKPWTEACTQLRYEGLAAVNEQRLQAVLSKTGRVDLTDRAACRAVLDAFIDVEEALVDDGLLATAGMLSTLHAEVFSELEREARKLLAPCLRAQVPRGPGIGGSS